MFNIGWLFKRWFWSGVGLLLLLLGLDSLGNSMKFIPYAEKTTVTITAVETSYYTIGDELKTRYDLTVEYPSVDGGLHSAEMEARDYDSHDKQVGGTFEASYNSNDYSDVRTDGVVDLWFDWMIKISLGLVFLFLALFKGLSKFWRFLRSGRNKTSPRGNPNVQAASNAGIAKSKSPITQPTIRRR